MYFTKHRGKVPYLLFFIGFTWLLVWAFVTDNRWEDWYITYRASKNLATGNGLVYTAGERIHSFTSPLGTLVPAACCVLTGGNDDDASLWMFRVISSLGFGVSLVFLYVILKHYCIHSVSIFFPLLLFLLDGKSLSFSINGMETGLLLPGFGFLLYSLSKLSCKEVNSWRNVGYSAGLLMWLRPDSFIYTGTLCLSWLLLQPKESEKLPLFKLLIKAALLAVVVYLPWFVWAWWYYGSPIPNTIIAKGLHVHSPATSYFHNLIKYLSGLFTGGEPMFLTPYHDSHAWPLTSHLFSILLLVGLVFAASIRAIPILLRASAITAIVGTLYINSFAYPFPWYFPTATYFAWIGLGGCANYLISCSSTISLRRVIYGLFSFIVGVQLFHLTCTGLQLFYLQRLVEVPVRKSAGIWLRDHALSPKDSVFLEPLGYMGFYSNLKMYDSLGLASKEVINARASLHSNDYGQLIRYLKPDWVVLRPMELSFERNEDLIYFRNNYKESITFDATKDIYDIIGFPGWGFLEFDSVYTIYHRVGNQNINP